VNVVIVDRVAQPEGWQYYTQGGVVVEPLGNGEAIRVNPGEVHYCDNMSLLQIFRGLFDLVGGTSTKVNVLVVCHANTEELLIRISDRSKA
jgi:hypothetical protein